MYEKPSDFLSSSFFSNYKGSFSEFCKPNLVNLIERLWSPGEWVLSINQLPTDLYNLIKYPKLVKSLKMCRVNKWILKLFLDNKSFLDFFLNLKNNSKEIKKLFWYWKYYPSAFLPSTFAFFITFFFFDLA